ncbi:MAG: hypothetical protein UT55_C0087G0003 [Candidatus Peregrinibacteria bacterium GW2011_GWE2_39_6]|nr:MAG: hypothetical protein UT36_C0001G0051 [Candidatus Peregrinibacteria bacterium GW2011_GWF2_39_17]KKR23606.1 MAG: hypothetical protein UT55_C0087G0003 [Candidatus Peregrinibacteria bacterium GW2011_GWE2_39_6]HCW32393.1 hypothetical protein [Candidatus Peregrinibacteria bacterium]
MALRKRTLLADATLFYFHAGLFAFSEIIFLISLPILFWQQGFSLSFIFAFYALAALPGYFFTISVIKYFLRTGIKKILVFGVFLYILLGSMASFIQPNNLWWVVALILLALQALCYWPARHLYFSEIASLEKVGQQAGTLNAVMILARTIAPIIAGLIALLVEFNAVFIFGAVAMLFSSIPIFLIKTKVKTIFSAREFWDMKQKHPIFKSTRPAYVADGVNSLISYLLWPLLFFLLISKNDYLELGYLMTGTYGISAIIMVVVGRFFDRSHRKSLLKMSVFFNILAIIGRFSLLFIHPWIFVYGVQSFYSFSESALQSTFEAYWYSYSKATNAIFFTIHREINYALGRFLIGMVLALVAWFLPDNKHLWLLFLLSIPTVLVYLKKGKTDSYLD